MIIKLFFLTLIFISAVTYGVIRFFRWIGEKPDPRDKERFIMQASLLGVLVNYALVSEKSVQVIEAKLSEAELNSECDPRVITKLRDQFKERFRDVLPKEPSVSTHQLNEKCKG